MTIADTTEVEADEYPQVTLPTRLMSEDEFETWVAAQEYGRYEWVEGKVIMMAPVGDAHDDVDIWLTMLLRLYTEEKDLGVVRSDVEFRVPDHRRTPDVFFLRKDQRSRLLKTHLQGPPNLAVEIISPSSESNDWRVKFLEYQTSGVDEYWIIDPASQVIECYTLEADQTYKRIETIDGKIASRAVQDFYLRPKWLWQQPLPRVAPLLREMGVDL